MTTRRVTTAVIVAAVVLVAVALVVALLPTGPDRDATSSAGRSSSVLAGHSAGSPGDSARTANASPPPDATPSKTHGSTPSQDNSLLTGIGGSSETIPTATPTPYRLHPTTPPTSIGANDVTLAPNSKVSSKSISTTNGATQLLIDATTSAKPKDTVAYFQGTFTALGMTGKPIPAVGGSTAIAFSKGPSTVTLTVSPHDKGSSYLIHGVLRTGA